MTAKERKLPKFKAVIRVILKKSKKKFQKPKKIFGSVAEPLVVGIGGV